MHRIRLFAVPLLALVALLAGCDETNPQILFAQARYNQAELALRPHIPQDKDKDYALWMAQYSSAAIEGGDYLAGGQSILVAETAMNDVAEGGDTAAVVVAESLKAYRGDPYEKMMAHTYSGFLALRNQDYENALAAFRRALVADQDTRNEEPDRKEDFVTAHYFAALCYHLLGEGENAAVQMALAGKYAQPSGLLDMNALNAANTFVLISSGTGPFKVMSGPGGSMASLYKLPDPVGRIELECDGQPVGAAAMTDDLMVQAAAQGLGDMDKIRIAKGVSKEAMSQVPYGGLAAGLINAEADIRVWSFLPGKLYVWSGRLEPGVHTLALRCYGVGGQRLPNCDQVWFYVPVHREKINFLNFRVVPDRQNIADKVVVPCAALVEKKK